MQFAKILKEQGRAFVFQPPPFRIGLRTYRPDFYLPDENKYIDVVGTRQAFYGVRRKLEMARKLYGAVIEVVRPDGTPYSSVKYVGWGNGLEIDFFPSPRNQTVKELRRSAGLRGYEIAKALGLSPAVYSAYERDDGKSMPPEIRKKILELVKTPQAVNPLINPTRILGELKKIVQLTKPVRRTCRHCGHEWKPRFSKSAVRRCPKCLSQY